MKKRARKPNQGRSRNLAVADDDDDCLELQRKYTAAVSRLVRKNKSLEREKASVVREKASLEREKEREKKSLKRELQDEKSLVRELQDGNKSLSNAAQVRIASLVNEKASLWREKDSLEEQADKLKCVVCQNQQKTHSPPCNHLCVCEECLRRDEQLAENAGPGGVKQLDKCPMCRAAVGPGGWHKVYLY